MEESERVEVGWWLLFGSGWGWWLLVGGCWLQVDCLPLSRPLVYVNRWVYVNGGGVRR